MGMERRTQSAHYHHQQQQQQQQAHYTLEPICVENGKEHEMQSQSIAITTKNAELDLSKSMRRLYRRKQLLAYYARTTPEKQKSKTTATATTTATRRAEDNGGSCDVVAPCGNNAPTSTSLVALLRLGPRGTHNSHGNNKNKTKRSVTFAMEGAADICLQAGSLPLVTIVGESAIGLDHDECNDCSDEDYEKIYKSYWWSKEERAALAQQSRHHAEQNHAAIQHVMQKLVHDTYQGIHRVLSQQQQHQQHSSKQPEESKDSSCAVAVATAADRMMNHPAFYGKRLVEWCAKCQSLRGLERSTYLPCSTSSNSSSGSGSTTTATLYLNQHMQERRNYIIEVRRSVLKRINEKRARQVQSCTDELCGATTTITGDCSFHSSNATTTADADADAEYPSIHPPLLASIWTKSSLTAKKFLYHVTQRNSTPSSKPSTETEEEEEHSSSTCTSTTTNAYRNNDGIVARRSSNPKTDVGTTPSPDSDADQEIADFYHQQALAATVFARLYGYADAMAAASAIWQIEQEQLELEHHQQKKQQQQQLQQQRLRLQNKRTTRNDQHPKARALQQPQAQPKAKAQPYQQQHRRRAQLQPKHPYESQLVDVDLDDDKDDSCNEEDVNVGNAEEVGGPHLSSDLSFSSTTSACTSISSASSSSTITTCDALSNVHGTNPTSLQLQSPLSIPSSVSNMGNRRVEDNDALLLLTKGYAQTEANSPRGVCEKVCPGSPSSTSAPSTTSSTTRLRATSTTRRNTHSNNKPIASTAA